MKEVSDLTGQWWLPESPDQRFYGRLSFDSHKGATLEATIENSTPLFLSDLREYKVIHGVTTKGNKVSLVDCFDTRDSGWSTSGLTTKQIFANLVFDGFHLPADQPAHLSKVWTHFPMLVKWMGLPSMTVKRETKDLHEFSVSCRKIPKLTIAVDETLKIEIAVGPSHLPWEGPTSALKLEDLVWVTVLATPSKPHREMLDILITLEAFFSLACHALCTPEDIRATGDFDPTTNTDNSTRLPIAEIFYIPIFRAKKHALLSPDRFLFKYSDAQDIIEVMMRTWIQNSNRLRPIRALYQTALYGEHTYLESEFLSIIQAVEVFHRRFRCGQYISSDEFGSTILPELAKAIPAKTSEEFRRVIENKLQYLNEFSLNKRLKELIGDHKSLILELAPDALALVNTIVQFRNQFTHYSGEKPFSESEIRKMVRSVDVLRLILELSLLKELGMPQDTLQRIARENRFYSHIKRTSQE